MTTRSNEERILAILAAVYGDDTLAQENSDNLRAATKLQAMLTEARFNELDKLDSYAAGKSTKVLSWRLHEQMAELKAALTDKTEQAKLTSEGEKS